ncbi:loricrin isoform X1 [Topomyia yanbarensis]|uniref:loricrin isoform X1 n=1 Tax=Topomyia yanbarensis TaxID=2498891 RepID=UPI00273C26FF|nr:loricrin isoform X1 [Topomyia yanbarensis]XP_058830295.1 loricrin isoform X1 [Topomyia yanbarensis]XP_058830296.1 loricrin isoform X1 [Topomyia yanbarensis]
MAIDAVFRKLVTCALVASLAFNQPSSCASLSGESTVGGGGGGGSSSSSLSSSQLAQGSPTLGSLYRSTRDEYGRYGRDQRCGGCGGGGGYSDRDMRSFGGRPGGVYGFYSGRGSIYDDRNWYYRPDAFEDRAGYRGGDGYYSMRPGYMGMMMGYDDRYMNRNDDRYYPMSTRGYYDNRGGGTAGYYPPAEMGMRPGGYGYRGNGYDNLDPLYDHYMMVARGGGQPAAGANYNRDRYYGTSGGYGGGYDDRNRGGYGYDNKNFRPWDETYRGTSGFDNSGRGYYFASRPPSSAPSSAPDAHHHHQQYPSPPSSPPSSSSSSSHYHHQSGYPTGPAGTYASQPIGFHHSSGPDRPDSAPASGGNRPCCAECCSPGSSRYPPGPAGPTGTGAGYNQPHHHYQQQQPPPQPPPQQPASSQYGGGERPDHHGRPGAWNYLSGGSGASASGGGGGGGGGGGQDYHQASSAAGGSSYAQQSNQDYGNRGGYHRPGGDDRQQNTAYSPRPRPSSLGSTSYLLDRDSGAIASELQAAATNDQLNDSDSNSSNDQNNNSNSAGKAGDEKPSER